MIWLDGEWLDEASIDPRDRGFTLGDGLFETMRTQNGAILRLDAHMARMRSSAEVFGLPDPWAGTPINSLAREAATQMGQGNLSLRYSVSAGAAPRGLGRPDAIEPKRMLVVAPASPPPDYRDLALATQRRSGSSFTARHKTLSYADNIQAHRLARGAGADLALLLDTRGYLSGCDSANLYWNVGGEWFTPALDCGVLAGTVRAQILDSRTVHEVRAPLSALHASDCVLVSNAMIGLVPVRRLGASALRQSPVLAADLLGAID